MLLTSLRRYEAGDREAVWSLHNQALHAAGAHPGSGAWDDDLHAIEEHYIEPGGDFIVGFVDDELVAMGAIRRGAERRAEIKRMRVHPRYQRQGAGRQILARLEARAVALGYREMVLETTTQQPAARGFYEKHGYTVCDEFKRGSFDIVRYQRTLCQT